MKNIFLHRVAHLRSSVILLTVLMMLAAAGCERDVFPEDNTDVVDCWKWTAEAINAQISQPLRALCFVDSVQGWAAGGAAIVSTSDGGLNWTVAHIQHPQGQMLWGVHFLNADTGLAVGDSGRVLATVDGGSTWTEQHITTGRLYDVHLVDSNQAWAVGTDGLYSSVDGGPWTIFQGAQFQIPILADIHFVDELNGWAVGVGGVILHTSDGGSRWIMQADLATTALASVHFVDREQGWTVGTGGDLYHTVDGGTTWMSQLSPTSRLLYSVHFLDSNLGMIVGEAGAAYVTDDAGQTWQAVTTDTDQDLFGVQFVSATTAYVCGWGGTVLRLSLVEVTCP